MKKKYLGGIVMILLVFFAGCGLFFWHNGMDQSGTRGDSFVSSGEDEFYGKIPQGGRKYIVVGFSQIGSESDWRIASTKSFRSAFTSEDGYYFLFENAQQKQENQLKDVRNFILQEVDYIILDPIVETGWDSVLKEARNAGIPVILVDRSVVVEDNDLFICWVGSDYKEQGRCAGKWLEKYLKSQGREKDKINIVTLQGTLESSSQINRTEGFSEVLATHSKWNMLERRSGEYTQAKGKEVMEDFLESYKKIDVLISENDNMTFGAIEAIKAAGKTCGPDGDIIIISFDAVHTALQLMLDGKIHVDFESNPLLGPMVSDIIKKLEKGEKVEKVQYVEEQYFDTSMDLEKIIKEREY